MAVELSENLLISVDDFKFYAGATDRADNRLITASIIKTQDNHVKKILGTALFQKMLTEFNADNLTGLYAELYNSPKCSLKKMVVNRAYVAYLRNMTTRIDVEGVVKSDQSVPAGDLVHLINSNKAVAIQYENEVKRFLIDNQSDIPELYDYTETYVEPDTNESNNTLGFGDVGTIHYGDNGEV